MDYRNYIVSHSQLMLGKPVIKGTRITVELILKKLSEGASTSDIVAAYPSVSPEAVNAVLAYAADVISNEFLISAA